MFLYQGTERDCYDSKGKQKDDINSTVELIMSVLGYDKHADDEDNDEGNNFLINKSGNIVLAQQDTQYLQPAYTLAYKIKPEFPALQDSLQPDIFIEIATPPPNTVI